MEANLIQDRDNIFTALVELETESHLLEDMRKRGPASQLKLLRKEKELSELDQVFAVTLKQIARGEKEESDLTEIRARMDAVKLDILNLQDLSDILKRTEIESVVKVGKLGEKVRGLNHSFWFAISQQEAGKIREMDAGPILRSYGAFVLSGLAPNFGNFLMDKFNGVQIDLTKIMAELQKEFLAPAIPKKGGK